jgi:hypothetical protein
METAQATVTLTDDKSNKKKHWVKIVLNFLIYGGWILVVGVGLATAIVLDMYVF